MKKILIAILCTSVLINGCIAIPVPFSKVKIPDITGTIEPIANINNDGLKYRYVHNEDEIIGKLNVSETGDFHIKKEFERAYFFIIPLGPLDYYWHATFSIYNKDGNLFQKEFGYIGDVNERVIHDIKLGRIKLELNKDESAISDTTAQGSK